ncbi:MAG: Crp/Fnr family transcriptional regulator [Rhodocyclaceae bacterium]|nr:Crp/Fnr family transcriptional regulator [Rhodocyclaceae bacterium]
MNAIYATAVGTRQIGTKAVRTPDAPPLAFGWSSLKEVCALLTVPAPDANAELRFRRQRTKAGRWVYGIGETFDALYIVLSGFLKMVLVDESGNEQILGFPMKGDVLGMDGLCANKYVSQPVAICDSELVVIPFNELSQLGKEYSTLENWLYRTISRELVREHEVIGLLGTLGAEARVARFLVMMSDRFKAMGFSATQFHLRMTRQEIGNYLGLSLETVSRSLSAMHDAGYIEVNRRALVIKALDVLRTMQRLPTATKHADVELREQATPVTAKDQSIWSSLATV